MPPDPHPRRIAAAHPEATAMTRKKPPKPSPTVVFWLSDEDAQLLADHVAPLLALERPDLSQSLAQPRPKASITDEDDLIALCDAAERAADQVGDPDDEQSLRLLSYRMSDALLDAAEDLDDPGESFDDGALTAALPGLDLHDPITLWMLELLATDWEEGGRWFHLNPDVAEEDVDDSILVHDCRELLLLARETGGVPLAPSGGLTRDAIRRLAERGCWIEFSEPAVESDAEDDAALPHLRMLHTLCKQAGLLRRYAGKLVLTRVGRQRLRDGKGGPLLKDLFVAFYGKTNWLAMGLAPHVRAIGTVTPAHLLALAQAPDEWLTIDCFRAQLVSVEADDPPPSGRDDLRAAVWSLLLRPLALFALVAVRTVGDDDEDRPPGSYEDLEFRLTPLFDDFLRFTIPPEVLALGEDGAGPEKA